MGYGCTDVGWIAFIVIGAMTVNSFYCSRNRALGTGIVIGTTTGTFKSWVESPLDSKKLPRVSTAMLLAGMPWWQ